MNTIVAVATGRVSAGICIVRLSGDKAIEIANKCTSSLDINAIKPRELVLCNLDFDKVKDKAMVVKFCAPYSFTGEDVVEFHLHGGVKLADIVLNRLIELGAVLAQSGEFSKRAFLNGKLSLEEAEGIIDVINAESEAEINAGHNLIIGKLRNEIEDIQSVLTDVLAEIEVALDYPEEDIDYLTQEQTRQKLLKVLEKMEQLYRNSSTGTIIKSGVQIAIVGKPNVGKSSLLNAMLNYDKAIVTDIAGTTRDVIDGTYEYNGVKFTLLDTAGIRESEDIVEKMGVQLSINTINSANVIVVMFDASKELDSKDQSVINLLQEHSDKPIVVVQNKLDNENFKTRINKEQFTNFNKIKFVDISAKEHNGVENLKQIIFDFCVGGYVNSDAIYLTNARHVNAIKEAIRYLNQAIENISLHSIDCICLDIKEAWNALGEITGKCITEDVVEAIFSKFCLGK